MTIGASYWLGSSRDDLRSMPKGVRADFGFGLQEVVKVLRQLEAQSPLKGFRGGRRRRASSRRSIGDDLPGGVEYRSLRL